MPISRSRDSDLVQDRLGADDPRLCVARPSRLAFGHAAKLRRPDLAIIDRIGDPSGAPHDVSRAISERSGLAARISGGSGGAGVVVRAGAAEKQEPGSHHHNAQSGRAEYLPSRALRERLPLGGHLRAGRDVRLPLHPRQIVPDHKCVDSSLNCRRGPKFSRRLVRQPGKFGLHLRRRVGEVIRQRSQPVGRRLSQGLIVAAHRFISRCERIPDSWSYIATLGFVLAFIVTADNLGELRAQSRAPEIAAAMAAEGVAEIGRRSDAYSYLSPCPQQTVIDVMGAQSFAIEPGPGGRPLVTIDRPVAAPCAYAGMVIDRRAQQ